MMLLGTCAPRHRWTVPQNAEGASLLLSGRNKFNAWKKINILNPNMARQSEAFKCYDSRNRSQLYHCVPCDETKWWASRATLYLGHAKNVCGDDKCVNHHIFTSVIFLGVLSKFNIRKRDGISVIYYHSILNSCNELFLLFCGVVQFNAIPFLICCWIIGKLLWIWVKIIANFLLQRSSPES